jgi:hypothetical protein
MNMFSVLASVLLTANFTAYPGFGDRGITTPRKAERDARVEATIDRGPIVELIVRCPSGTAIISYSKVERLFCGPKQSCGRQIGRVLSQACGH